MVARTLQEGWGVGFLASWSICQLLWQLYFGVSSFFSLLLIITIQKPVGSFDYGYIFVFSRKSFFFFVEDEESTSTFLAISTMGLTGTISTLGRAREVTTSFL